MSKASIMVSSYKDNNKDVVLSHIKAMTTRRPNGEDMLYYFDDGSIAVHKTVVNEIQLFKG